VTVRVGFPAQNRLKTAKDFDRVFAKPMRSSDRYFTILARHNDIAGPRLGLAVSKRAAKHAVDRNRLKRLVRETFRLQSNLPRCDFVVMAKPMATEIDNSELRGSLERHFARLSATRRD